MTGNERAEPSVPTGMTWVGSLGVLNRYTNTINTVNMTPMIIKLVFPLMILI